MTKIESTISEADDSTTVGIKQETKDDADLVEQMVKHLQKWKNVPTFLTAILSMADPWADKTLCMYFEEYLNPLQTCRILKNHNRLCSGFVKGSSISDLPSFELPEIGELVTF